MAHGYAGSGLTVAGGGALGISAGTQSEMTGTIVFSNSNGITFGMSNSSVVTASHNGLTSQSNQAFSAAGGSSAFQTLSFSNANGISFSNSDGQVQASYTVPSTAGLLSAFNISAGTTSNNGSAFVFSNGGGVSFGLDGSTVTATVVTNYQPAGAYLTTARASNDALGLNTAATNVTWTANSAGVSFDAGGYAGTGTSATNASVTLNSNGLAISVAAPGGGGLTNINVSAGTTSNLLSAVTFANANGITFGLDASTITASHNALTTARASTDALGLVTAATNVTWTANSAGVSINAAGYAGTGTSATNASVTLNSNGLAISVAAPGGGAAVTETSWSPVHARGKIAGQQGQGALHVQPARAPDVQFDRIFLVDHWSNATNSSGTVTLSHWLGLYTKNASTLSLLQSTSSSWSLSFSGTAVGGQFSLFSNERLYSVPFTTTLTAGDYYIGVGSRTTSGGANGTWSQMLVSNVNTIFAGHAGVAHNVSMQYSLGLGTYSTTTAGIPNSIAFSDMRGSGSLVARVPVIMFMSSTV